jgi:hypothetical protein
VDLPLPAETSTLYVEVGGEGFVNTGGWNGGGGGPFGGGGASDIRTVSCGTTCATGGDTASLNSRLAVASGGGGASDDQDGGTEVGPPPCALCGATASISAGGAAVSQATVTSTCQGRGDMNGEPGSDGSLGLGGAAATFLLTGPEDGGGGGGWYGGGGGAQCYDTGAVATVDAGSGGAGSSYAPTAVAYGLDSHDSTDPAEVIVTAPVPTATSPPTVAGGLTVGDVLSESHAQWSSGKPLTGYTYQWERCNASGADCAAIDGATGQTYKLLPGDLGDTIRVQETAENFYGSSATAATSAATGVVVAEAFTLLGSPTASGSRVRFSLRCRAAILGTCRGSAQLTTLERLRRGKIVALFARPKRHRKRALVGSKRFTLADGKQEKIVVPLNKRGAKLLASFRRIPATLTIALLNTTPPTTIAAHTTIGLKRKRHH